MKFQIVVFAAILAIAVAEYNGNGEPDCKSNEELNTEIFRNTWDPTAYWKCNKLNAPAELVRCPENTAFVESKKACVGWSEWRWLEPVSPPNEVIEANAAISADIELPSVSIEGSSEEAQ